MLAHAEVDDARADDRSVTNINIRAPRRQKDLIDRAAHATGKTRTEFVLESACKAAEDALLDQRMFYLDEERFEQFMELLDAPPQPNEKLRALLSRKAPWDK
jgi:uncharacterized protein (DUF1778 family)